MEKEGRKLSKDEITSKIPASALTKGNPEL